MQVSFVQAGSAFATLLAFAWPLALRAAPEQASTAGEPAEEIRIVRASGPIEVDGSLDDPGWTGATRVDTFYEGFPGDSVTPKVKTVAWLAYDEKYLFAAFELSDPDPQSIRAPYGERDRLPASLDYGGVILDTRNDGKTGFVFQVSPHNIQYDAIFSDASGEDSAADFYWDSAARIGSAGWTVEIRIPFSSLRYHSAEVQNWGIILYRNYPRDFRYQIFSSKLSRGSTCLICHQKKLTGLAGLPGGNHLVAAPYVTGQQESFPAQGQVGNRLIDEAAEWDGGLDVKWTPNADTAIDAALQPDFSQVESDVAQITANERFALFFAEKRPFFLEGLDLLASPLNAVYTRTITSPRWGARATGQLGSRNLYTILVAEDRGGGVVVLPGSSASSLALQDFSSRVALGRFRRDFGRSFVSFLATDREIEGGGHNRVAGPSLLWRPNLRDAVSAQLLWSETVTPVRPELTPEWNGRDLASHAIYAAWDRNTRTYDWHLGYRDLGDEFRADLGFIPQVGIREASVGPGWSFFPTSGLLRRIHPFVRLRYVADVDGGLLQRQYIPGINLEGVWGSYLDVDHRTERLRVRDEVFDFDYSVASLVMVPGYVINVVGISLTWGGDVDVVRPRLGRGGTLAMRATLRPTDHLALELNGSRRWLAVSPDGAAPRKARLFTAEVGRLKATYAFNSRTFLRLIGQRVRTERDTQLFLPVQVPRLEDSFSGSALFAYKLNWQTVLFVGYGDDRALAPNSEAADRLEPAARQLFLKVSYAFQR